MLTDEELAGDNTNPDGTNVTLDFIRNGGALVRYHTVQVLQRQTIAEHSFHVAMLVWWLKDGDVSGVQVMQALAHDVAEHKMGDMPSPVKNGFGEMADGRSFRDTFDARENTFLQVHGLNFPAVNSDAQVLKLADAAEGCLYCIREREMGNRLITECYINYHRYVFSLVRHDNKREVQLLDHIDAAWERACGYQK